MISNRRRNFLVITSVCVGTVLSALLLIWRKGKLGITGYSTLAFNMLFAVAIIIGVSVMLGKKKKK